MAFRLSLQSLDIQGNLRARHATEFLLTFGSAGVPVIPLQPSRDSRIRMADQLTEEQIAEFFRRPLCSTRMAMGSHHHGRIPLKASPFP